MSTEERERETDEQIREVMEDMNKPDYTGQVHSPNDVLAEAQKLCSYVLGCCNLKAEKVIEEQKLNHENPVHLMGLTGTIISEVFMRDLKKMNDALKENSIVI